MTGKRPSDQVLTWDEYFMGLAHLSALRSKDPHT
ncbi:MAG: cytidine deaminase, partial [Galactobacillus timonensis]|nr:cytidine deaminase [Galactobacillus timonensis]